MNQYALGQRVVCSVACRNPSGTLANPDVMKFEFYGPGQTPTTYTYPADAALVRDSTGLFHAAVSGNLIGKWHYRFYSPEGDSLQVAAEGAFSIAPSAF